MAKALNVPPGEGRDENGKQNSRSTITQSEIDRCHDCDREGKRVLRTSEASTEAHHQRTFASNPIGLDVTIIIHGEDICRK